MNTNLNCVFICMTSTRSPFSTDVRMYVKLNLQLVVVAAVGLKRFLRIILDYKRCDRQLT